MTRVRRNGLLTLCIASLMLASVAWADGDLWPSPAPLGTGWAAYDPSNGHILLNVNQVALWRLDNDTAEFIGVPTDLDPGAGVRWTIPGTLQQVDPFTIGEALASPANSIVCGNQFNPSTLSFDYTGVAADLGQLLPSGLEDISWLTFRYQTVNHQPVSWPVKFIPEPTTGVLTLLGLGVGSRLRREHRVSTSGEPAGHRRAA